jgi:hypothetical protein
MWPAQDQDMLLEFYLQQLAKRLLLNKTAGLHLEEETIARMKGVFGLQFVAKIVSLVTNYRIVAADELGKLDNCDGVQLDVMTLKASSWPSFPLFADVIPPPAMAVCMQRFTLAYGARNPMHKVRKRVLDGVMGCTCAIACGPPISMRSWFGFGARAWLRSA